MTPLLLLSPTVLRTVAIAGAAAGLLWGFHAFTQHQQGIGYARAQGEHAALEAQRAQYETKVALLQKDNVLLAEQNATKREQDLRAVAASAGVSAERLRSTINRITAEGSTATVDALRASNAAFATVLQDCTKQYGEMGKAADGHANDVRTMMESWPKGQPQ